MDGIGGAETFAVVIVIAVVVATVGIGGFGVRLARSTSDFLVASRSVSSRWNAAAIAGEYLSAASFLGIAGLVLKIGPDALWYPIGFTSGYLALLMFVAAPLRRSGAYTLPDFAEARLGSNRLRKVASVFVVVIGWLYLVPQFQGAGLTLNTVAGLPMWVGSVAVATVVVINVVFGGMRAITFVQAFQYWLKLSAIAVPAFVLLLAQAAHHGQLAAAAAADAPPVFVADTTVTVDIDVLLQAQNPTTLTAAGRVDGADANGQVFWAPGQHRVDAGASLRFPAGTSVPVVAGVPARNSDWAQPFSGSGQHPLLAIYSLLIATFLGTMGLPHVLVRFYTNPDGKAARYTTLVVLGLLGLFYLFPVLLGVLARLYVPQLLVTGHTDAAVLLLPGAMLSGWPGWIIGGLVAGGAFAAFLSTSSGLVVSVSGVLSTDVLRGRVRDFRVASVVAGIMPLVAALFAYTMDVSTAVTLAFAVAASTFCPLLVLGIWWRGLTDLGAGAGLVAGGALSLTAVVLTGLRMAPGGVLGQLLATPAAVTVPISFAVMVVVSKLTAHRVPEESARILARLHAPETLGLSKSRSSTRFGPLEPVRPRSGRHRNPRRGV
jgi:Na+(H+)/acetate symporter ActP